MSDFAINILVEQELTSDKFLMEASKEDLKELGLKLKDILAIQRMFK